MPAKAAINTEVSKIVEELVCGIGICEISPWSSTKFVAYCITNFSPGARNINQEKTTQLR